MMNHSKYILGSSQPMMHNTDLQIIIMYSGQVIFSRITLKLHVERLCNPLPALAESLMTRELYRHGRSIIYEC